MIFRILTEIAFFLSIFLLPWFVTLLIGVTLLVYTAGYEVVVGGLVIDLVYGTGFSVFHIPFFFTLLFSSLFVLSHILKRHLIVYTKDFS